MTATVFKDRYANEWGRVSNRRERIAEELLRLVLPAEIVATGNGVGSSGYTSEEGSMPDFYMPALRLWFEVTGSSLTKQSLRRCTAKFHRQEPCLFVREGKVEAARLNRVASKLWFVSVNEMDGSVLFMPCSKVVNYPLVEGYESGGGRYYMVPWAEWMRPYRFVSSFR